MLSTSQNWACREKVGGFLCEIERTECTIYPVEVWGGLFNKIREKADSVLGLEAVQFPFSLLDLPRSPSQDVQPFL